MILANKDNDSAKSAEKAAETAQGNFFACIMGLMIVLVIGLFASGKMTRGNETRNVFEAMVQTRGCVVADVTNRRPSSYRCDHPVAGQYVDAEVMWDEAVRTVDARYDKK